jgi:hypothetical protein
MKRLILFLTVLCALCERPPVFADDFFCFERGYPAPFDSLSNLYCFDLEANNALITNMTFSGRYDRPQYYPYVIGQGRLDVFWYLIQGTYVGILEVGGQYFAVDLKPLKRIPEAD